MLKYEDLTKQTERIAGSHRAEAERNRAIVGEVWEGYRQRYGGAQTNEGKLVNVE